MLKIDESFIPVEGFTVPNEFWPAFEYEGEARFVAMFWTPSGDEAIAADGRISHDANWYAYLMLMRWDPNTTALRKTGLEPWCLGSSEEIATHWLIVDREANNVWLAPSEAADRFLHKQWPESEPITIDEKDWPEMERQIKEAFKRAVEVFNETQPEIDLEALMKADAKRLKALELALDNLS